MNYRRNTPPREFFGVILFLVAVWLAVAFMLCRSFTWAYQAIFTTPSANQGSLVTTLVIPVLTTLWPLWVIIAARILIAACEKKPREFHQ